MAVELVVGKMNDRFGLDAAHIRLKSGDLIPLNSERTVCIDLNGASLTQPTLDIITAEANREPGCVNIVLRRVGIAYGGVPRLIADRGEIYDALTKLLKQRNKKQLDSQNELT